MNPELVLNLKNGDDPEDKLNEWLNEYARASARFPLLYDKTQMLSLRVKKAYELYVFRNMKQTAESHDDACYIEYASLSDKEDSELDGNFSLGMSAMPFLYPIFLILANLFLFSSDYLMKYTAEIIPNIVPTF